MIALRALYPRVQPGGYVIVDDYRSLEECRAAVDEFRREHRVDEPLEEADWNSVRWRREHASMDCQEVSLPPATRPATSSRPPVGRAVHRRVPAIEELRLGEELERVRERLARAETEVAYLTGSPLRGPRRWLGRVLRGAG
jgi:hypothetical protein